ncbi:hypothetical protein MTO96_013433 [Rhipicephalus appendiculatus]
MSAATASRFRDTDCLDSVNARQNDGGLEPVCNVPAGATKTSDRPMGPSGKPSKVVATRECHGPYAKIPDILMLHWKMPEHQVDLGADEDITRLACNGVEPLPAKIVRGPESVVAVIGGHVHLAVVFVGTPDPRVTWTKGGKPLLPAGDRVSVSNERSLPL